MKSILIFILIFILMIKSFYSLNNYIIKMNDQRVFNELADFSDLRRKHDQFNTINSKNSASSGCNELDFQNNDKIMKSFKQLREKLKNTNRQNQNIRQQMNSLQVQIRLLHQSENNLMNINHQLKQKNNQLMQNNQETRKRMILMKESVNQKCQLQEQTQFLKNKLMEIKVYSDKLEEERKKIIEISIEEKMGLEEQIRQLQMKKDSDDKHMTETQNQLFKFKQNTMRLENELKKLQIKFDQQNFNKKWNRDGFEKEHYQKHIKELQNQIVQLKNKNRKEKEKRADLENRVLELQEISGLWSVKAEAYEGQVDLMTKKVKKMERRMSQAKSSAKKMASQRISWQQKFERSVMIAQELIGRVKRQLLGDMVQLAKSCEFRINKLKENQIVPKPTTRDTPSIGKKTQFTDKKRQSIQKQLSSTGKIYSTACKLNFDNQEERILTETLVNQKIVSETKSVKSKETESKQQSASNYQNQNNLTKQYQNIELKVRKQRQQMQRKLKQRMLFRKIEVSSSPDKPKLRSDYLKMVFDR